MTTACSMPAAAGHDLDLLASNPSPTGGSSRRSRGVPAVPLAQPRRQPSNKRKGKAARQAKASKQVPQGQPQPPPTPEAQPHPQLQSLPTPEAQPQPQRSPWYQRLWQQAAEASTSAASGSSPAPEPPTRPRRRTCSNPGCGATERPDGGKLLKCERCRTVRYCSAECQKQHWHVQHRAECVAPASASDS